MTKNNTATVDEVIEPVLTLEQQEAIQLAVELEVHTAPPQSDVHGIVWSETMNTSQKIKSLARMGHKNASIQKILNPWYEQKNGRALRYQHVRNVLTQTYKKD
jgi:hypothetical protein